MQNMSQKDLLVLGLKLAITAPSEEKAQKCVELVEQIASGLSEFEVATAKREALAQLQHE